MIYVALLRGINVGGNHKVPMSDLKQLFEKLGFTDIVTYINSGNVIFSDSTHTPTQLVEIIEPAIEAKFGFYVKVLIRDANQIKAAVKHLDPTWVDNKEIKCDILFLSGDFDHPRIISELKLRDGVDHAQYTQGALIWWVERKHLLQSAMVKLVGTKLYKSMTIRTSNTVSKLNTLIQA